MQDVGRGVFVWPSFWKFYFAFSWFLFFCIYLFYTFLFLLLFHRLRFTRPPSNPLYPLPFSYLYHLQSTSLLFYNFTFLSFSSLVSGLRYPLILTRRPPTTNYRLPTILNHLYDPPSRIFTLLHSYTLLHFYIFLRFYAFYTLSFGPLVLYTFGFSIPDPDPPPVLIPCLYSLRPTPYSRSLYPPFFDYFNPFFPNLSIPNPFNPFLIPIFRFFNLSILSILWTLTLSFSF